MGSTRKWIGRLAILGVLVTAIGWGATGATAASTGSFTKAISDPTWTTGDVGGSVRWDSCPVTGESKCVYWKPFVLLQPALPSYSCAWEDAWDDGGDRNIRPIWAGATRTTPGTSESFDLPDTPLLAGVQGQRVCLVAIIPTKIPDQLCINQSKVFEQLGYPPLDCPLKDGLTGEVIGQSLVTEKVDEEPTPPTLTLTVAKATSIAKGKFAKKYGRSWSKGSKKTVTCKEKSALFVCGAKWKSKGNMKRGTVLVYKPGLAHQEISSIDRYTR